MALNALLAFWNSISSSLSPLGATCCLPSHCWGGVPSRRGCCFCYSWNCSTSSLISQHSSVLWCLELCIRHRGPPSSLPEGRHNHLSPRGHIPHQPQQQLLRQWELRPAACCCCCHQALAHLSTRLKSSETSCTSCVANFWSIFSSLTPCQNVTITKVLEMQGVMFQTWENHWMKDHSDSHRRCCTTWRSTSLQR
jgi:hypothetical protein